jgi:uncharacterized membrane protein YsdA (DUF1294 family)
MIALTRSEMILFGFFLVTNSIAFFMMLYDKRCSRNAGTHRIAEGVLFFWAAAFGSLGIYLGMLIFRHKTKKWYFMIGITLLFFENLACLYVVSRLWLTN